MLRVSPHYFAVFLTIPLSLTEFCRMGNAHRRRLDPIPIIPIRRVVHRQSRRTDALAPPRSATPIPLQQGTMTKAL